MSRKPYSEEEIALIASCPYVKSGKEKGVLEIFDAYDVPWQVIGREKAMKAAVNWLHKAKTGQPLTDQLGRSRD